MASADVVQTEAGQLVTYTRIGPAPDLVSTITEGTGRATQYTYAPFSDATVYQALIWRLAPATPKSAAWSTGTGW